MRPPRIGPPPRSEEHTSELQSRLHLVCRLLLEKKKASLNPHCAPVLARSSSTPHCGGDTNAPAQHAFRGLPENPVGENKYFFFNDTATTEIYTLSLHDALPI